MKAGGLTTRNGMKYFSQGELLMKLMNNAGKKEKRAMSRTKKGEYSEKKIKAISNKKSFTVKLKNYKNEPLTMMEPNITKHKGKRRQKKR